MLSMVRSRLTPMHRVPNGPRETINAKSASMRILAPALLFAALVGCFFLASPLSAQDGSGLSTEQSPAPVQPQSGWAPVQEAPKAAEPAAAMPDVAHPDTAHPTSESSSTAPGERATSGTAPPPSGETNVPKAAADNPPALPSELSPWGMFLAADIVVKSVMVGLAAASFLVWTIWIAKCVQLALGRRRFSADLHVIASQPNLTAAVASVRQRKSLATAMLDVALREKQASGGNLSPTSLGRIHSRLSEIEQAVGRDIRGGMSFLATVAATGPFIGLFGTVWGIMNSFIGISKSQTTNLAVVAPGIAEALLATAIGLVAAIPAVILYNHLGKGVSAYRRLARETRGEVERIASREMDDPTEFRRYRGLAAAAE